MLSLTRTTEGFWVSVFSAFNSFEDFFFNRHACESVWYVACRCDTPIQGATKDHEGVLLPLSTRKEFKKELRADAGIKAAMKAAAAWAASVLNVGVTAAAGCGASADESGKARAADIGKKRSDRAAKAGHSHSHSHSHGGLVHSHSHGGHSHGAGEAVPHGHIGHTHSGGGGGKSDKRSASAGRGKKATAPGKKNVNVVDHRSSGWAHSGSKRAVRGLSAKEAERKVGSSDEG